MTQFSSYKENKLANRLRDESIKHSASRYSTG